MLDFVVEGGPRHRLAIHPERQRALWASLARSGHGAERESPLFLAAPRCERRKPLTRRQVSQWFHRYAREAGLPLGVTPHRARTTSITEALDCNCPIEAVQASVGHRPIATTQRYDPRKLHDRERASFAVRYAARNAFGVATCLRRGEPFSTVRDPHWAYNFLNICFLLFFLLLFLL